MRYSIKEIPESMDVSSMAKIFFTDGRIPQLHAGKGKN